MYGINLSVNVTSSQYWLHLCRLSGATLVYPMWHREYHNCLNFSIWLTVVRITTYMYVLLRFSDRTMLNLRKVFHQVTWFRDNPSDFHLKECEQFTYVDPITFQSRLTLHLAHSVIQMPKNLDSENACNRNRSTMKILAKCSENIFVTIVSLRGGVHGTAHHPCNCYWLCIVSLVVRAKSISNIFTKAISSTQNNIYTYICIIVDFLDAIRKNVLFFVKAKRAT